MMIIRISAEFIAIDFEEYEFKNSSQVDKRVNTIIKEIDRITELVNFVLTIFKDGFDKTIFNPIKFALQKICFYLINNCFSVKNYKKRCKHH